MEKINLNERVELAAGRTNALFVQDRQNRIVLSKPGTVYIIDGDGIEHLIGYGHDIKFRLEDATDVQVWASVQGVMFAKEKLVYEPQGEVFTNFDKRPTLSPLEASVKLALRRLHAEQKLLDEERRALDRQMVEGKDVKNPPPAEPETEATQEPAPEPTGDTTAEPAV